MRLINYDTEPPGGSVLATFDVELSPDVTIRRMVLRRNTFGERRCFPARLPNGHGCSANLAPHITQAILKLALASLDATNTKGQAPDAVHQLA